MNADGLNNIADDIREHLEAKHRAREQALALTREVIRLSANAIRNTHRGEFAKADELIETQLKPRFIEPPPEDQRWNYIIDIGARWHRSFFHFGSTYASPGPNALSPTFESPFARMEYVGDGKFNLAYMRHTGKWWEVYRGLTADE